MFAGFAGEPQTFAETVVCWLVVLRVLPVQQVVVVLMACGWMYLGWISPAETLLNPALSVALAFLEVLAISEVQTPH